MWQTDAELAGKLERGHKVHITLLVARCVEPGEGQSERGSRRKEITDEKVSASKFADHSRLSRPTVLKYLKTWDEMSKDGIVPPREELSPGVDVDLPDQAKWKLYYTRANSKPSDESESTETEKEQKSETKQGNKIDLQAEADLINALSGSLSPSRLKLYSDGGKQHLINILSQALEQLQGE